MNQPDRSIGSGKRIAAILAFAAAFMAGPAMALTVSLPGFTCTTPTVTSGSDIVTIVCGTGPPPPPPDPNANVSFQFAAPTSATNVAVTSPTTITVMRSGGTAGSWNVPYTLGGSLTTAGALTSPANGTLTGSGTLSFPANSPSASIAYTAPLAAPPAAVTAPWTLTLTLIPPPVPVGTPPGTQTAALGTILTHTLTLNAQVVGQPPGGIPVAILAPGQKVFFGLTPPEYSYSVVPDVTLLRKDDGYTPFITGKINLVGQLVWTPNPPVTFEAAFSKTIGDFTPTLGCYFTSTFPDGFSMRYMVAPLSIPSDGRSPPILINDAATATAAGYCWTPKAEGTWYLNIRWAPSVCQYPHPTIGKCVMGLEYFGDSY